MKILLVGASGVLGSAVSTALSERGHDVVEASRQGEYRVDLRHARSITALYDAVGQVDAVACTAGKTPFAAFGDLALEDYSSGLEDKLLGQIELVRQGIDHVTPGGGFTLVSGVLAAQPIATGTVASTVNGGVEAFVTAGAAVLPHGLRLNAVSPTALEESWGGYAEFFPGFLPVPAATAALAYVRAIEGVGTGQIHSVGH
ncbi:short chain dehydrogenase [Streptomyces sp. 110]|uniref:Short chain dehydrogenase n=1 Tax=Streptomyces endocoffeicus TaxID=2898945 RepID=A0ABS1PER1_9ACTN|nr:short chain dehydrogenase [Streptomyces endocoffeicus]MBL1110871.1 short chain dehydrogenase [Streptomyces endocoffeicus]